MGLGDLKQIVIAIVKFIKDHAADFKLFGTDLLSTPLIVVLSGTLLAATLILGYIYWGRASNYESIINGTLISETEQTSQSFKGLESFIFSNIPGGIDEVLKQQPVNPAFSEKFKALQLKIREIIKNDEINKEIGKGVLIDIPEVASGEVFTDSPQENLKQGAEQKKSAPGYLFLPSYLIRHKPVGQQSWPRGTRFRLLTHDAKEESSKEKPQ